MLLCGTDVIVWYRCHCVVQILLCGTDGIVWYRCYGVVQMSLCGTDFYCVVQMSLSITVITFLERLPSFLGSCGYANAPRMFYSGVVNCFFFALKSYSGLFCSGFTYKILHVFLVSRGCPAS